MTKNNIYDNISPEIYENRRSQNEIEHYQYEHWQPSISKAIEKYSKNSVVLDLGCGPGAHAFEMAKYAKQVFGVDSSERMINYARQKYPRTNFVFADAANTPFENGFFDSVFSFGLFEYVEDKEKLMKEISRVLKPGGVSVILAPNRYSFPRFLFFALCKLIGKKRVVVEPSFGQMLKMFRAFNFGVIDYKMDDGLFFLPYTMNFFGKKTWLFIEKLFKNFKRNPFSMNMLFIIKKNTDEQ